MIPIKQLPFVRQTATIKNLKKVEEIFDYIPHERRVPVIVFCRHQNIAVNKGFWDKFLDELTANLEYRHECTAVITEWKEMLYDTRLQIDLEKNEWVYHALSEYAQILEKTIKYIENY